MPASLSVAFKNRILNEITGFSQTSQWLASSASSNIKFYTGSGPGIANAVTGTLLATIPLFASSLSLMAGSNLGIAPLIQPIAFSPTASGTIGYARWFDSSNQAVIEGSVGLTGSGADFIVSSTTLVSGVQQFINACSVKLPAVLGTVQLNSTLLDVIVDRVVRNIGTMPALGVNGAVFIYTGSAPASVESAPTGTLLGVFSTGTMAYSTSSGVVSNLVVPLVTNALDTGVPGYARLVKDNLVMQMSVGASGADVILSSMSLTVSDPFSITDMSMSL